MASLPYAATALVSAARTTAPTTVVINNTQGYKGIRVIINATASAATPSVVPKVRGVTPLGVQYDLLIGAAITGAGQTVLLVYPGAAAVANLVADAEIGPRVSLDMTPGDADSLTYSVEYELLP